MFGIDDAIGAAIGIAGGAMQNSAQSAAADKQMAFQREMFGSRYQTTVEDMKKAGLNPMLAYSQGPGSVPSGAMPDIKNVLAPAVSSALQVAQTEAAVSNTEEQTRNLKAQEALTKANTLVALKDAQIKDTSAKAMLAELPAEYNKSDVASSKFGKVMEYIKGANPFMNSAETLAKLAG